MNEFRAIQKYFYPLTNGNRFANSLQDDVAAISLNSKNELIISKDLAAEDIHFRRNDGAYNIACKILKSNLSDLAASGAKPKYYMLGFSQSNNFDEVFLKEFCRGLKDVGNEFGLDLIGGDSIKTKSKLCFSVTIFGEVLKGKSLKRSNAQDGDLIFVSNNIGDAFLGLQISEQQIICPNKNYTKYLVNRHLKPSPRIDLGFALVKNNLSKSAIDISDGFLADLLHICNASNLDATIYQNLLPISVQAKYCLKHQLTKNKSVDLELLLSGGEDYELIFTSHKKYQAKITQLSEQLGIKITCVGSMKKAKKQPKIELLDCNDEPIKIAKYGYFH